MNKLKRSLAPLFTALAFLFSSAVHAEKLPKITAADLAAFQGIECFIIDLPEDIDGKMMGLVAEDQDGKRLENSSYCSTQVEPGERIKLLLKVNEDRGIDFKFVTEKGSCGGSFFDDGLPRNKAQTCNTGVPHVPGNVLIAFNDFPENTEFSELRVKLDLR